MAVNKPSGWAAWNGKRRRTVDTIGSTLQNYQLRSRIALASIRQDTLYNRAAARGAVSVSQLKRGDFILGGDGALYEVMKRTTGGVILSKWSTGYIGNTAPYRTKARRELPLLTTQQTVRFTRPEAMSMVRAQRTYQRRYDLWRREQFDAISAGRASSLNFR